MIVLFIPGFAGTLRAACQATEATDAGSEADRGAHEALSGIPSEKPTRVFETAERNDIYAESIHLAVTFLSLRKQFTDNSHVIELAKAIFDSAIAFGREVGSTSAAVIAEAIRAIDRNVATVPCSQPLNPASVDLEHFRRTLALLCRIAGSDPARIRASTPKA